MKYMSRPKSAAVKGIDIADILSQKYRYCIDIGKGDIDPSLSSTRAQVGSTKGRKSTLVRPRAIYSTVAEVECFSMFR